MMKINFPLTIEDTGDKITLVKSKKTGKFLWWNITKGMFCCLNTPFLKGLKKYAEEQTNER